MLTNKYIRKKPDRLRQIPRAAIPRQQQFHQNQHHHTRRFVRVPITFPIAIIPLYLPNHIYLSNPLKQQQQQQQHHQKPNNLPSPTKKPKRT